MRRWQIAGSLAAAALLCTPAAADVWIAGNGETLDVLVFGNSPDTEDRMADQASAIGLTGWIHLWQGEPGQTGWIGVSCVRKSDGDVQFELVAEQPSQAAALDLARSRAQQFIADSGGSLIENCGGSIENRGQKIEARLAFGVPAVQDPVAPRPESAPAPTQVADEPVTVPYEPQPAVQAEVNPFQEPPSPQFPADWALHLEAVTVCELVLPWSRENVWRCMGPSSIVYVNFTSPDALAQLKIAGSNPDGREPRDLGRIGRFYVFGWGMPLATDPDKARDAALRMGVPPFDLRYRYWCPPGQIAGCVQE